MVVHGISIFLGQEHHLTEEQMDGCALIAATRNFSVTIGCDPNGTARGGTLTSDTHVDKGKIIRDLAP